MPRTTYGGDLNQRDKPFEDGVELSFADQESVVLRPDRAFGVGKVERDTVVQLNDVEVAEAGRHRPAQHLGKELGGGALVRAPDDGVIELDSHDAGSYRQAGWIELASRMRPKMASNSALLTWKSS